jgi:hypothetical protein
MNANEGNPFLTKNYPSTGEAFGSSMNEDLDLGGPNDVPF